MVCPPFSHTTEPRPLISGNSTQPSGANAKAPAWIHRQASISSSTTSSSSVSGDDPGKYIPRLEEFKCAVAPLFSVFIDMPFPTQLWQHYRSRLLAQILSDHGIPVIPAAIWGMPDTCEWCFDGLPRKSLVAVNSMGYMKDPFTQEVFLTGLRLLCHKLDPEGILAYGCASHDLPLDNVIYYDNEQVTRLRRYRKEK